MARKRAPGGGRKRLGPGEGKTGTLSTRVSHATRLALEREAKRKGHSLSREVEYRLDQSFKNETGGAPNHIRALAHAVTLLAVQIERATGEHWCEDAFTGAALRHGIETLMFHFAPTAEREVAVPRQVEESAGRFQPPLRESYRNPALFGQVEAGSIITSIERAPSTTELPILFSTDPYGFWQILRDVGSGWERRNKETKS